MTDTHHRAQRLSPLAYDALLDAAKARAAAARREAIDAFWSAVGAAAAAAWQALRRGLGLTWQTPETSRRRL